MPLYRLGSDSIESLPETTFAEQEIKERADLQRILRQQIDVVAPDVLVISEEFCEWDDSRRRIDLLGIDSDANLVVFELKRGADGGFMDLQAIRYAAMVTSMTFSRAIEVYQSYLDRTAPDESAEQKLLDFLQWSEPNEDEFARDVRIVLVSADFSKELTTAVLWLNEHELDIRCVRMKPYEMNGETIVDVQQIVPLPEAEEYTVRVREKASERREAVRHDTGYWFMNCGEGPAEGRLWEDCKQFGFMLAGGNSERVKDVKKLKVGDKLFAYLTGHGYVGFGEVVSDAAPFLEFVPPGHSNSLGELPLKAKVPHDRMNDRNRRDWCVGVRWIHAIDRQDAVLQHRARRGTLQKIRQPELVSELLAYFDRDNGNQGK